ncbi:MAG: hypothetical protein IPO92_08670 [Saprospiraceae bacterium]|nr:hypothetical protein [Saprospiraceae bacterium]
MVCFPSFFGWLVFGIIFKDAMNVPMEGFMKPESEFVMWAMVVSNLMWGLLMAYIFVQWANISTWMSGQQLVPHWDSYQCCI